VSSAKAATKQMENTDERTYNRVVLEINRAQGAEPIIDDDK
jgi:hypothetical protein